MSARLRNLNPYDLHKHLINEYILCERGSTKLLKRDTSQDRTDLDVIRENHKFLWDDTVANTWEKQLAKKYFDKLFKEYCICDLSLYKENKIALRWRVEKEVIIGKGQFICGNKKCQNKDELRSWEVNFAYSEDAQKKNALVKSRLCPECSKKLNYHSKKREIKRLKKQERRRSKLPEVRRSVKEPSDGQTEEISLESPMEAEPMPSTTADLPSTANDADPWKKGNEPEEKTREQEFEEYLEDLLL